MRLLSLSLSLSLLSTLLLTSSFPTLITAQSCATAYGPNARCDIASSCPAGGGTSGYAAQSEALCPTVGGIIKVCCINFRLTSAFDIYDATASPWQEDALKEWQKNKLDYFTDVMQKFACMYRNIPYVDANTACGAAISLTNAATYYDKLKHQTDAILYLQSVAENWLSSQMDAKSASWVDFTEFIRGFRNTLDPTKWTKPTSAPVDPGTPSAVPNCGKAAASSMELSKNGLNLIKHFESWFSCCYTDSVGVRTVGYGHACHVESTRNDGSGCGPGINQCSGCISRAAGESFLAKDMKTYSSCVKQYVRVPITQNQFDALTSFAFNVGCGGLQGSTLLRLLNQGSLTKASAQYQFSQWHSGCLEGLKRRRFAESELFNSCAAAGSFGCSENGCDISYGYTKCASNCQYCSKCGGCSGSSTSASAAAASFVASSAVMTTCAADEFTAIDTPCTTDGDTAAAFQCSTAAMSTNTTVTGTCSIPEAIPITQDTLPTSTCTATTTGIQSYSRYDRYDSLEIDGLRQIYVANGIIAKIVIRQGFEGQMPSSRIKTYAATETQTKGVYLHTISDSADASINTLVLQNDAEQAHSFTDTGNTNIPRDASNAATTNMKPSCMASIATAFVTGMTLSRSTSIGLLTGAAASSLYMAHVDAATTCTTYTELTIVLNPVAYATAVDNMSNGRLNITAAIVSTNSNIPTTPDAVDCLDAAVAYVFPTLCSGFKSSSADEQTALSSNIPLAAISQAPLLLSNAFSYYDPKVAPHQTCAFNWLQTALGNTPIIQAFACTYRNKVATSPDPSCGTPIVLTDAATAYSPTVTHQQQALATIQPQLEARTDIWPQFVAYYRKTEQCVDWTVRTDGRCGPNFGNAGCGIRDNTCCSVGGWCGDTDDHCNPAKGGYDWKQGRRVVAATTTSPPTTASVKQTISGDACFSNHPSNNKPGVCISNTACAAAGGVTAKGLCPGDASILCCGSDSVNVKVTVDSAVCGSYASSPTLRIAGNDGTYNVVKILRAHLEDPSAYDAAPTERDNTIKTDVACKFDIMRAAAAAAGVTIRISSGFRTVARQQYFYHCSKAGCCCCNGCALAATPGSSNHGYGIALDLNTNCGGQDNVSGCRSSSSVYRWLAANGARYGFNRAVVSEPWHWEYHGSSAVKTSYT